MKFPKFLISPGEPIKRRGRPRKYGMETAKERATRLRDVKAKEQHVKKAKLFINARPAGFRLLAISDVHNNIVAVRKLRAQEKHNVFDAITIAGDLCDVTSENVQEIFHVLSSFQCPIMYVYGNHDSQFAYKHYFGRACHLIHLNVIEVGGLAFTGFSGGSTGRDGNPIARRLFVPLERAHKHILDSMKKVESDFWHSVNTDGLGSAKAEQGTLISAIQDSPAYKQYLFELKIIEKRITDLHREKLVTLLRESKIEPAQTVIMSHERTYRLGRMIPNLLLHIFGHAHQFREHEHRGTRYVNVGALGSWRTLRPADAVKWSFSELRNVSAGNYCVIEIDGSGRITSSCRYLRQEYKKWAPLEREIWHGLPVIPEEKKWLRF